jgi:hypothetical protein
LAHHRDWATGNTWTWTPTLRIQDIKSPVWVGVHDDGRHVREQPVERHHRFQLAVPSHALAADDIVVDVSGGP